VREAFGREGYLPRAGFLHYAIEQYPLRIVALDTQIPGEHSGLLCAERLAWFDSALAAAPARPTRPDAPPALRPGIAHMDRYGLRDTAAFGEIVSRNRQIERILCGHFASRDRPPLCRHGRRDRAEHGPSGLARSRAGGTAAIRFEPPGYQLQLWREGAGLVSHTAVFGDRPGPYPFRAAG
jgi:3',5'-cyclic-AMP phosphodiesterase